MKYRCTVCQKVASGRSPRGSTLIYPRIHKAEDGEAICPGSWETAEPVPPADGGAAEPGGSEGAKPDAIFLADSDPAGKPADTSRLLKDGEPCWHPGCLHHVTHPCEGCGRTAGVGSFQPTAERFADLMKGEPFNGPVCQVDACGRIATHVVTRGMKPSYRLCNTHATADLIEAVGGKLYDRPSR